MWSLEKHMLPLSSQKLCRMLMSTQSGSSRLHPEPHRDLQFGNIQENENFVSTPAASASPPSLRFGASKSGEQEGALAQDSEYKMSGPALSVIPLEPWARACNT